jgi:hypothetical protein
MLGDSVPLRGPAARRDARPTALKRAQAYQYFTGNVEEHRNNAFFYCEIADKLAQ